MDKDVYYFPHDYNARNDPKITAMRTIYGAEGYGWYWMIIEILRAEPDYRLPINKYTFDGLAMQMQCDRSRLEQFIKDSINEFKDSEGALFQSDGQFLWSNSLLRRMNVYDERSAQARDAAYASWQSRRTASALPQQSNGNASRVEKSRVEKSRVKKSKKESPNFRLDSEQVTLSQLLLLRIQERDPKHKGPSDIQGWAKHVDDLIRLDERTPDEIRKVIEWCQKDSFWRNNILSTSKLRIQFGKLFLQMGEKGQNNASNKSSNGKHGTSEFAGRSKFDENPSAKIS